MERGGEGSGAGADEAEEGWWCGRGTGVLQDQSVCGWGAGVPRCFVGDEVGPERGGEAGGDYDAAAGV